MARIFFRRDGGSGTDLWVTNGTSSHLVKDIAAPTVLDPTLELAIGNTVYFTTDDGVHGRELWRSDGTAAGTALVKDIKPGHSQISSPTEVNGVIYFNTDDGVHGNELWRTDGTEAGTRLVKDINVGGHAGPLFDLVDVNGTLYFAANDGVNGRELWKTDGTEAGTAMVKDINPAGESMSRLVSFVHNGQLYFNANDGGPQFNLWRSDGTAAGTVKVHDLGAAGASASFNGALFVVNRSGTAEVLRKVDANGVTTLQTFTAPESWWPGPKAELVVAGSKLFAVVNKRESSSISAELWTTDGTPAGTTLLEAWPADRIEDRVALGNTLVFIADEKLWRSDGTDAGTVLVRNDLQVRSLKVVGDTVFMVAFDEAHGFELWKTDGSTAGTQIVKDIRPGDRPAAV
jgi:ELWxxDGT repeat protein